MIQNGKTLIKSTFVALAIMIIVGYTSWETRKVVGGPSIEITSPSDGASLDNSLVTISGVAKNVARISLNDRPIFVDASGQFKEQLLLEPGYNVWQVSGTDKFGRTVTKTLELVLRKS